MSKKYKKGLFKFKLYWTLIFASAVTEYVSNSDFVCLFGIPSGIRSSAIG